MSEYFEADVNGDGVEDVVAVEQYEDGSMAAVADTDGDGLVDIAAYDVDGDGVADQVYTEEPTGLDASAYGSPDPYASDGSGAYATDYAGEGPDEYTVDDYNENMAFSDALRIQHETNMQIIKNIG